MRTPFGSIGIGDDAAGLCGGMVFAALDYWHAGIQPPAGRPAPGSPLHNYVVRRLIASWHIPAGVARYYQWMNLPDGDTPITVRGRHPMTQRGLSRRTIAVHWPRIRTSLDAGVPAVLGVVTVASPDPAKLRHNHQVLAFGYAQSGSQVTVRVYDPNSGPDDSVWIRFDASSPRQATAFSHNLNLGWPVRGFFLAAYSPVAPPAGDLPPATPERAGLPPAASPANLDSPLHTAKGQAVAGNVAKGDLVDDFELPDETGTPRKLSDLLAGGPVVLFF